MKKKKLISAIILFALALSSCERCPDDTTKRSDTNRNATNDKEMLAEKELTEEDKFYSEAQVAWDAVSEAHNRVTNSHHDTSVEPLVAYAESLDKLALILDRGESKNWKFISRSNNIGEPNVEYCRTEASDAQEEADRVSVELGTKDAIVELSRLCGISLYLLRRCLNQNVIFASVFLKILENARYVTSHFVTVV